jgi:hypothetical protein
MFRVIMEVPEGATIEDCRSYIQDAVTSWGGGYRPPGALGDNDPGDPFFSLNKEAVKVTHLRETL